MAVLAHTRAARSQQGRSWEDCAVTGHQRDAAFGRGAQTVLVGVFKPALCLF